MTDTFTTAVIPALRQAQDKLASGQAGIQIIDNTLHEVGQHLKCSFARYAELYDKLDSGLRRNDGV